jgi:DNA polymerase-3 subunit alpha
MSKDPRFIHLRVHTEYSLLEGAIPVKKLPGLTADMDMPAVAVTDSNNMFCALEFSEGAAKAGVQPIIGCQVDVTFMTPEPGKRPEAPAPIVLLAQSETGYMNLMKLNSCAYLDADGQLPQVSLEDLAQYNEGLI